MAAVLNCLLDELECENSSAYVLHYTVVELRKLLHIPSNNEKVNIVIGKNWVAKAVEDLLINNQYICVPADVINWNFVNELNANFWVCEENAKENNWLVGIKDDHIIRVYILLEADFLNAPAHKKIFSDFEEGSNDAKVVCLVNGLSYGRDAIHCDLLVKPALTLANSGQDLYYDYLCLQYAYKKMCSLGYVITTIAPYSLRYDESMTKSKNKEILFYYTLFGDTHHNMDILQQTVLYDEEKRKTEIAFAGGGQNFSNQIFQKYYPMYYKEQFKRTDVYRTGKMTQDEYNMIVKQYQKPYDKTVVEYVHLLREYCAFCKEKKIKLLFLIPPYSQEYKKLWKEEYYLELVSFLEKLVGEFGIEYVDMSHKKYPEYCFRDSGHLNRLGAIHIADVINVWLSGD